MYEVLRNGKKARFDTRGLECYIGRLPPYPEAIDKNTLAYYSKV